MEFSKEELAEARRQVESTLHKLRRTVKTLDGKGASGAVQVPDHAGAAANPGV